MIHNDTEHLKQLGAKSTEYKYSSPSAEMLETFPYTHADVAGTGTGICDVEFSTDEFTSLCPKTGQPDFASIKIRYVPGKVCIESKSLKLYLFAWRNEQSFMETIINTIADHLQSVLQADSLTVTGYFEPRGGLTPTVTVHRQPAP